MIQASTAFQNAVIQDGRTFRARILAGGSVVDCEVMKATIRKGASDAEQFLVGSCYSSSCEVTVTALEETLVGRDISLQIGILTDETTVDYITVGVFTVVSVRRNDGAQVIVAQGAISAKLSDALPTVATQTLASVAAAITTTTGATITFDTGIDTSGIISAPLQNMSCRSALALLAFLVGGYATEDASGGIVIKKYASGIVRSDLITSDGADIITDSGAVLIVAEVEGAGGVEAVTVLAENCLQAPIVHETDFDMTGVKVIVSEEYETEDEDGESVVVPEVSYERGTIRQVYNCEYMTEALFAQFADNVVGYTFMPAEIDMSLGDPRIEPWDILRAHDVDGSVYNVPCNFIEASFDGGFSCKIIATGESEAEDVPEGAITQALNSMQTQIYSAASSAATAHDAAESAKQDAAAAARAASDAQGSAETAAQAASDAQGSAKTAQSAADSANGSANTALTQLGVVENVVGVLDLLTKHGNYQLTTDTTVQAGKWYFVKEEDNTYQVVNDPAADPATAGYYELTGIDEAVQNYVSSHLVLADNGLWLQTDGSAAKLQLSTSDGVVIYNENGTPVAQYGEDTIIGDKFGFHIKIDGDENEIGFFRGDMKVAYMNGAQLYVENSLSFGHFMFYERNNGHFTLKYIGGN